MFIQGKDEVFRSQVLKPYAHKLVNTIVLTLLPHLDRLKRRPGMQKEHDPDDLEYLQSIFKTALSLKQSIDCSVDLTAKYLWSSGKQEFDSTQMRPERASDRSPGEVMMTLIPGVEISTTAGVRMASRTLVMTRLRASGGEACS